jgi:hypothetical protein
MEPAPTWLACLQTLAAAETVRLEAIGGEALDELLARGLIQKDERPKQVSLEARYEALQETHRHLLEARGCAERLHRRLAPRSRFAGLLGVGIPPPPGPDDPDVVRLLDLLEQLKIQVRGVKDLDQIPAHLDRIQDYIQVEGRECLDRLADTDREIDTIQKQAPPGTHVEPGGFFTLTPAGEAALPEAPVLETFETALQTAFGPLTHRSASSAHFREDPASLLTYLLEGMARGGRPSALVSDYEGVLEAYDRVSTFSDLRSLRAKIAFLVRLLRAAREEPKRAYLWCNRERLNALVTRMRPLVPSSVAASGWHLPYAVDLFLADGGLAGDEGQAEGRTHLFQAVHRVQSELLMDTRIADGQFVRLVLTLTHAARVRNFTPGVLMERFVRQAYEAVVEAALEAPYQLGDRGTRLLFGAHLAHAAGFAKARLRPALDAFRTLHERLGGEVHGALLPVQAQLHAFVALDRLERLGAPVPLEVYAGLVARLRKRLRHHKVVARAFRTEQAMAEDEAALIANLAARVCFHGLPVPGDAKRHPDAGMAGLYEGREAGLPPLLGSPFGTLMLS